jgi:flavin reductase (DIM6/NTAB) family NADH-FMN oxidoreductase RutF
MDIRPDKINATELYKILTGCVLPRPIAWVSSVSINKIVNLAPFSFFNVVSVKPPVLGFSPLVDEIRKDKDTLVNIRDTGEFVINIVSHKLAERMNQTSAAYANNIDEFDCAGLKPVASETVRPPGVAESLVRFECRLRQLISFGSEPYAGSLILGNVCHIHLHENLYNDGKIDADRLDAIGRLAGNFYTTTRDRFAIARPVVPCKPGHE